MASNPPISFDALAKTAANPASGGYPYSLKGFDLDKNFTFATEDFDTDDFTVTTGLGAGGHQNRKISLKYSIVGTDQGNIPAWNKNLNDGGGGWQMVPAPTKQGELLFWNTALNDNLGGWELVTAPTKQGEFLFWNKDAYGGAGGWEPHQMGADGSMIYFSSESKKWENITPADNSMIYYQNKVWSILTAPASGTHVLGAVDGALQWIETEEC